MLRSNHLQPGINLNTISFPSADLTLKVFDLLNRSPLSVFVFRFKGKDKVCLKAYKLQMFVFFKSDGVCSEGVGEFPVPP